MRRSFLSDLGTGKISREMLPGKTRAWVYQLLLDIFRRSLTTCFELSWSWRDRVLEWESLSVGIDLAVHLWDGVSLYFGMCFE